MGELFHFEVFNPPNPNPQLLLLFSNEVFPACQISCLVFYPVSFKTLATPVKPREILRPPFPATPYVAGKILLLPLTVALAAAVYISTS